MKQFTLLIFSLLLLFNASGQLYVNGDIYVQNNGLVYSQDTIQLASSANVVTNGIIQSTKGINTNGHFINTGTTGFIISPIASAVSKSFDIGTTTNNKLQIQHTTGITTSFQMAVRDNVYTNPETSTTQITNKVVGKTWLVQPLSAATNCNATLFWNTADQLTLFTPTSCAISKWITGSSTFWAVGTYGSGGASSPYSRSINLGNLTTNNVYLGIGITGSALPIHKLIFDAVAYKADVLLNWKAIEAFNNKAFDLERSTDGNSFYKLTTVNAIQNNVTSQDYNYKDEKAFTVTNHEELYYRLKQIDNDGKFSYSEIKRVSTNSKLNNNISIYPNPAKDLFYIKLISEKAVSNASIIVYNELGKQVLYKTTSLIEGLQTLQINSSQLSKGTYNVVIDTYNKTNSTQKIIIQ